MAFVAVVGATTAAGLVTWADILEDSRMVEIARTIDHTTLRVGDESMSSRHT
jgi:hypothetical protein